MTEKDNGSPEKFAVFVPVDLREKNGEYILESLGISSDIESAEQAAVKLSDKFRARSWSLERLNPDGSTGEKRFYFCSATWNAPWQPTGPRLTWIEPTDSTEPIN